jgi:hypothetical protein
VEETKQKIKRLCSNCFNCRVRFRADVKEPLKTFITPVNPTKGVTAIFCRLNHWLDSNRKTVALLNIKDVDRYMAPCIYWEGEENEECFFTF